MLAVCFRKTIWIALLFLQFGRGASAQTEKDEVYVLNYEEHTMAQIEAAYREMPPVSYKPPPERWSNLPRTEAICRKGVGALKIVMLGDSIVADTSKSRWNDLLQKVYPGVEIKKITCVRGGTGCWWYKEAGRVQRYVLDFSPDLVIIGGISHKEDSESVRDVVRQIRAKSPCDILLMTGAFGYTDPRDNKQWEPAINPEGTDYSAQLKRLAQEQKTGFLDMFGAWGAYVRSSGKDIDWFKRDPIHANIRGEQILGRILCEYFTLSKPR